jgi:hypothetical protein
MRHFAVFVSGLILILNFGGKVLAVENTTPVLPFSPLNWDSCLGNAEVVGTEKEGPDKYWVCFRDVDEKVKIRFFEKLEEREKFEKELEQKNLEFLGFPLVM